MSRILLAWIVSCCSAFGQFYFHFSSSVSPDNNTDVMTFSGFHAVMVITGTPYSAIQVTESTRRLADGTHIKREQRTHMVRDSQGRTRLDGPYFGSAVIIQIADPVENIAYLLDAQNKIAHRITPSERPSAAPNWAIACHDLDRQQPSEKLGSQMIEGLSSIGIRTTSTRPTGFRGFDHPVTVTWELWCSPESGLYTLVKFSSAPFFEEGISGLRTAHCSSVRSRPSCFDILLSFEKS